MSPKVVLKDIIDLGIDLTRRAFGNVRAAADVGGTFTDVVIQDAAGRVHSAKVPSTPSDYGTGIIDGIMLTAERNGLRARDVDLLNHATTVATNTVLERKGAVCGVVTTRGFRDVLELRRLRIPLMYDFQFEKPPELARRANRFELSERIAADGTVIAPLQEQEVRHVAREIARRGLTAVAICLINSYRNPSHERLVSRILREELGEQLFISASFEILPEIREYERTSTTLVNAYVGPVVAGYLSKLARNLKDIGMQGDINVMQSGGGLSPIAQASARPAGIIESGPAAGVIAAAEIAKLCSFPNVIAFDMGGTTAKASMIEDYEPVRTSEYEVGSGINISSRLVKGGGYPIRLPFIDISEIGAGGGSIIKADLVSGTMTVGPESAGAVPGPACYRRGGMRPTLTDALVVLGHINPNELVGGELIIDAGLSYASLEREVARPLGMTVEAAAVGAIEIAVATMTRAVKAVTTYRGRDPRGFSLVAFGGNGPVFAAAIADALGIKRIVVPPRPGVFSAIGLLVASQETQAIRSIYTSLDNLDAVELQRIFDDLAEEAVAALGMEPGTSVSSRRSVDLKYAGQAYELKIPVATGPVDVAALAAAFHDEHRRTYGHAAPDSSMDVVTLSVVARARGQEGPDLADILRAGVTPGRPPAVRQVQFGETAPVACAVIDRTTVGTEPQPGPLIIEEYDSTTVVPPGWHASRDAHGNLEITR